MAPRFLTILTGPNLPKIQQSGEAEPSTINDKTIADFTRVVEQKGIQERDLAWAKENCDGPVRVIVAMPRTEDGQRRIDECYPQKNLFMRVTAADPATGAFTLEQVVTDAPRP